MTLNSPPVVGGSSSNTFSINTYSTYSTIYLYISDSNSLEQAFAMAYSTYSFRRNCRWTVQCHPGKGIFAKYGVQWVKCSNKMQNAPFQ